MKKALLMAIFALMMAVSPTGAAFAAGSYAGVDFLGSYVVGSGFRIYDKPVFQGQVGHLFDNGLETSIWASLPASFENVSDNAGTEVDFCLVYHFKQLTQVNASIGASYFFMFPDKGSFHHNDVYQLNAEASKSFKFSETTVTPGARIEYGLPVNGHVNKKTTGLLLLPYVDLNHKVSDKWTADLMTRLDADLGGYGAEKALIMKFSPRIIYQVSDSLSTNAGIDIYWPAITTDSDMRENQYVPRVGLSWTF